MSHLKVQKQQFKSKQQSRKIPLSTSVWTSVRTSLCTDVDNVCLVILTKTTLWADVNHIQGEERKTDISPRKKGTSRLNTVYQLSFNRRAHLTATQY